MRKRSGLTCNSSDPADGRAGVAHVGTGERLFAALSEGASDVMPPQKIFWNAPLGQLTDKFGIDWMFDLQ